jgi:hypothetical protein
MVSSSKPRTRTKRAPRKRETLPQKFDRIMTEPADAPFPKLTKREAYYFLRRLAGSNPDAPPSEEVLRDFWGDWSEDEDNAD